jgi:acetyltransferase-like isoleucine patch superfamily enzyme
MMQCGKHTYGESNIEIHSWNEGAKLVIGNFCSIAHNIHVFLGGNHHTDWVTTYPFGCVHQHAFPNINGAGRSITKGDVIIGNDVWIGRGVTIMSGVTIGDGAAIAANSHVVKNVEPYTIVGGNPAKFIRNRFTPEQTQKLLEIKWWNWEDEKINRFTSLLCNSDIDEFIKAAEQS